MKIKKILIIILFSLSLVFVTGCNKQKAPDESKYTIVTTLYPNYEFLNVILEGQKDIGKEVEVILIVPYGTDSHSYDPSLSDYLTIKNCDLFIYTSDEMEPWVKSLNLKEEQIFNIYDAMIKKYPDFKDLQVLDQDSLVDHEHKHGHDHDHDTSHNHDSYKDSDNFIDKLLVKLANFLDLIFPHEHNHSYDPHFWTNMLYAEYMVEVIYDVLVERMPDPDGNKRVYMRENANRYIDDLRCLDRQFRSVATQAEDKTLFFGAPFAFYYFTYRYDLDYVLTYSTCSTEVDPSILVMIEVVEEMKHHNSKVILSKELTSDDAAKTIAEYADATVLELHSGHNISPKEVGKTSFLDIMQANVVVLAQALNVEIYKIEEYNQIKGGVGNVD